MYRRGFDPFNLRRYGNGDQDAYQRGLIDGELLGGHSNKSFLKKLVLGTQDDDEPKKAEKKEKKSPDIDYLAYGGSNNQFAAFLEVNPTLWVNNNQFAAFLEVNPDDPSDY